jgi:hypothetical protein
MISDVGHLPVGGAGDHVVVLFERLEPEQPVMIRRLESGRNAKKTMIGIESVGHGRSFRLSRDKGLPAKRKRK